MVGLKRLREKGISPMEVNSFTGPQHTKHVIRTSIIKATPANPTHSVTDWLEKPPNQIRLGAPACPMWRNQDLSNVVVVPVFSPGWKRSVIYVSSRTDFTLNQSRRGERR